MRAEMCSVCPLHPIARTQVYKVDKQQIRKPKPN